MIRLASKNQLAAGRLVAVEQDIRVVPAFLAGTLTDGAEFGSLRIQGRDHELVGWRVDFQTPATMRNMFASFWVKSADDTVTVPDTSTCLQILGAAPGGELFLQEAFPMPVGSLWKVVAEVNTDEPALEGLAQNVTFQWLLRPAVGPVYSRQWSANRPSTGETYWRAGNLTEG